MSAPPLDAMPEADVRRRARELTHENRRLRAILDALAKAGVGTGALFEVIEDKDPSCAFFGVVVCRADRDEAAFVADAETAMRSLTYTLAHLAETISGHAHDVGVPERMGVTRLATEGDNP